MTEQVFAAVAILRNSDGLFLAVNRRDDPFDLGFPGGKANDGEFPRTTAMRELREETTIVALNARMLLATEDEDGNVTSAHVVSLWKGWDREVEPGIIPRWVTEAELISEACRYRHFNRLCFQRLRWPNRA